MEKQKQSVEDIIRRMYNLTDQGKFTQYVVRPSLKDDIASWADTNIAATLIKNGNTLCGILTDDEQMLMKMKWAHAIQ